MLGSDGRASEIRNIDGYFDWQLVFRVGSLTCTALHGIFYPNTWYLVPSMSDIPRSLGGPNDAGGVICESRHHCRNCAFRRPYEQLLSRIPSQLARCSVTCSVICRVRRRNWKENLAIFFLFSTEQDRDFHHPKHIYTFGLARAPRPAGYVFPQNFELTLNCCILSGLIFREALGNSWGSIRRLSS